jgi:N6-L-threonylcarbamoyladenine synthase
MGLPYPGGPMIDKLAREGNPSAYAFSKAMIKGLDFSFSGLKTSFLYFLRDQVKNDPEFVQHNEKDLCASIQSAIIDSLTRKLIQASEETGIREIAVAGGVSANSGLREAVHRIAGKQNWNVYIPEIQYATDNAAMIAITGYFKYLKGEFSTQAMTPAARLGRL